MDQIQAGREKSLKGIFPSGKRLLLLLRERKGGNDGKRKDLEAS